MNISSSSIIKGLLILLAFTLQTQITLLKSIDYIGLRINITDIILPFIGIFILISLLTKKTLWPQFTIKGAYIWLIGLGGILIAALLNSYYYLGELSTWGLQNKIIGWSVLSALFLVGGWIGMNAKEKDISLFLKIITVFLLVIISIQITFQIAFFSFGIRPFITEFTGYPIKALMANKNSFVFLFLTTLSFLSYIPTSGKLLKTLKFIFWFLLPVVFLYTGARSTIIAIPVILLFLFFLNKQMEWKKIIILLLISAGLCTLSTNFYFMKIYSARSYSTESLTHIGSVISGEKLNKVADKLVYHGDSNRLKVLNHVFDMIKEKPILGSGLGSVLITQERENGSYIDLMDCTALWLWAETGLLGLIAFLTFYFLCFRAIWKKARNKSAPEFTQKFCMGAILMLITFGIMSLFHELLYTRFLWVFLGMALTLPVSNKPQTT